MNRRRRIILERAAKRAVQTGDVRDLKRYLQLRRQQQWQYVGLDIPARPAVQQ